MSKEKILEEYRKKFGLCDGSLKHCGCKRELDFISKAIDQTREETIRNNNLVDLTGKNGDTIYHNDGLTGKRYIWKCVNIEKLTNN